MWVPSLVPVAGPGCLKHHREVPAESVGLEQPHEGWFSFISLLSQTLEEEREALYARVQKRVPHEEQTYANLPSAPQPSEELYSTVCGR